METGKFRDSQLAEGGTSEEPAPGLENLIEELLEVSVDKSGPSHRRYNIFIGCTYQVFISTIREKSLLVLLSRGEEKKPF